MISTMFLIGQEQSIGMRAAPDLHLDMAGFPDGKNVPLSLSTPPHVLKLDEINFAEDTPKHNLAEPETASYLSDEPPNGYIYQTPPKDNR